MIDVIQVTQLEVKENFHLKLSFNNGLSGIVDLSKNLSGDVFSRLKDEDLFVTARLAYGTVVWKDDIDMAPEYLHEILAEQIVSPDHS